MHHAKVMCDEIFGAGAFRGEIIWVPGNGARGRGARASPTRRCSFSASRPSARRRPSSGMRDDPSLREPFARDQPRDAFQVANAPTGARYRERTIGGKTYRYFADEGRRLGSVWTDIPAMVANTPLRKEGTGYPTQKPEKLLERIVRAASQPGDVVADLMCGSGTTLVVAARLGRRSSAATRARSPSRRPPSGWSASRSPSRAGSDRAAREALAMP